MRLKPRYTAEEFRQLASQESSTVEFKRGLGRDPIQEAIVSFSNSEGGTIFVGVEDGGDVLGFPDGQRGEDTIHQAALAAHDVGRYDISQIDVGGRSVLGITVRPREEGFSQTSDGRVLVRDGRRNTALTGTRLVDFVQRRTLRRFESSPAGITVDAADGSLLAELRSAFEWEERRGSLQQRLSEQGLARESGELTVAGALFVTDPAVSLGQSKALVEVRRYPEGAVEFDRREEFSGPLHRQVAEAARFVINELGTDTVVTGLYRHELPRLPERAVREVIANAVAHRSYEMQGSAVVVELHPDELRVTSPGGLPEPVTVETLREAQSARNPAVINVLRRFRLAEDAGRGIDVIQDMMAHQLLDPPRFSEDPGRHVRVVLPLRGPITPQERVWISELEQRGSLDESARLVLVHAARGEIVTNGAVRQWLGVNETAARGILHGLRDEGLLEQHGNRGGAWYSIVKRIAPPAAYRMTPDELADFVVEEARQRSISNADVRNATGLDREQSLRLLRQLVEEHRLVRSGARRGTRYEAV